MLSTRLRRHPLISKSKNKYLIVKLVPKALASFQDGGRFSAQVFTARFYYVSHGNGLITCYEGTFRELGAVQLSPLANRKPLRYENKPRAEASSIVACLVLTEFRKMFKIVCNVGKKKRAERMERTNWQTLQKKSTTRNTA